jgi:hypothetical protein
MGLFGSSDPAVKQEKLIAKGEFGPQSWRAPAANGRQAVTEGAGPSLDIRQSHNTRR